jgi:hypothetical protein
MRPQYRLRPVLFLSCWPARALAVATEMAQAVASRANRSTSGTNICIGRLSRQQQLPAATRSSWPRTAGGVSLRSSRQRDHEGAERTQQDPRPGLPLAGELSIRPSSTRSWTAQCGSLSFPDEPVGHAASCPHHGPKECSQCAEEGQNPDSRTQKGLAAVAKRPALALIGARRGRSSRPKHGQTAIPDRSLHGSPTVNVQQPYEAPAHVLRSVQYHRNDLSLGIASKSSCASTIL